jgi:hypothetical protein
MLSGQLEFRPVMIEFDLFPILRGMATMALFSKLPLMLILLEMAGNTGRGGRCKVVLGMTFFAFDRRMFPLQRKFSFAMVKFYLFPAIGVMAPLALFAQPPFMLVVFLMAVKTGMGRLAKFMFCMTFGTFRLLMFPEKFKLGFLVVKFQWIQFNQGVLSPFMLQMAGFTPGGVYFSMKPFFLIHIFSALLMAVDTFGKKGFLSYRMAVQTVSFDLFMKGRHFPGHDPF